MTLTELRYIVTLAQEQHFGRAAERCYVSQPTLSIAVKKLEDELGVALFERTKSRVQPTPLGEQIVAQANLVLEQTAAIKDLADAGKDQLSSPLSVGAIFTIGPYLLPKFIPHLQQLASKMPLYVEEGYTHNLRKKLRRVTSTFRRAMWASTRRLSQPLSHRPTSNTASASKRCMP